MSAPGTAGRLRALDVFRGATVALMILVNSPGSWSHLYPPLAHAPWHGMTPTDLVFPFFLFAVGNALALVLPAHAAAPAAAFWRHVARRTVLIFAIGVALQAFPFVRWDAAGTLVARDLDGLRILGVLQRIALAFGAAAALVWLLGRSPRRVLAAAAVLLLGYWAACRLLGGADPYSLEGYFGTALDRALLGPQHLYRGEGVPFDPEGLASTVPAIAQVLLGWWAGEAVRRARDAGAIDAELLSRLCLAAIAFGLLAWLWQLEFPLNKKIWSSSYVLATTSLALLALVAVLHLVEVRPRRAGGTPGPAAWARGCEWFGRNALFVFVLSGLVPRALALLRWPDGTGPAGEPRWITPLPWLWRTLFEPLGAAAGDPRLGSLAFALANLAVFALVARELDRRRIYVRV